MRTNLQFSRYTPFWVTCCSLRIARSREGMNTLAGSAFTTQEKLVQVVWCLIYFQTFVYSTTMDDPGFSCRGLSLKTLCSSQANTPVFICWAVLTSSYSGMTFLPPLLERATV